MIFRNDNRTPDQLRPINIIPDFISTAEGSALIEMGNDRRPTTVALHDKFGRAITDLRISITDRCNYKCVVSIFIVSCVGMAELSATNADSVKLNTELSAAKEASDG